VPQQITPDQMAQELSKLGAAPLGNVAVSNVSVWLTSVGGYATLNWSATSEGYKDWIGLYADSSKLMGDYETYQWATKGSPYETGYDADTGQEARYYSYDYGTKQYVLMATGKYSA